MTQISRAIVLVLIVHGAAGCDRPGQGSRSPIPTVPTPQAGLLASSIFPTSGGTWRGTNVEILGGGFQPGAVVAFGSAIATNTRAVDSGTIWTRTPISAAGNVDVIVTNPDGARAVIDHAYTFMPLALPTLTPSATIVSPASPLSVSWSTPSAAPLDWISLYSVNSTGGDGFSWQYTGGATSGTFTLNAPAQAGQYEFRYLPDDGYVDVARSPIVTVR